jgi:hypothetical protein
MFVGRLLTDIYNPIRKGAYKNLAHVFFVTQVTTALLYDPLLSLIRKAMKDQEISRRLGRVLGEYYAWASAKPITDFRRFRHETAWFIGMSMAQHGLTEAYVNQQRAGNVRPETLLFSAFGVPSHIELTKV